MTPLSHTSMRFATIAAALLVMAPIVHADPPLNHAVPANLPKPPNILFIMADDHAAHAISAYGSAINSTPNIDRLAREGVRFTNCFCENALCVPSRAAIMTGTFSCRSGVIDLSSRLDPSKTTFPMLMKKAGYQTAIVGKWHLNREPAEFDYWDILPGQGDYHDPEFLTPGKKTRHNGYVTDIITDKCIDWLGNRDPAKPFLLLCHHKAPHRPWEFDAKHAKLYADADIPEPATLNDDYVTRSDSAREQRMSVAHDLELVDVGAEPPKELDARERKRWHYQQYVKRYLRCVASVDDNVGRLLDYLDTHDLTENTIVVYTSDQGFFLGDHGWYDKRFMYEEALRMPLLARYPTHFASGSTCDKLVQNIDFAPTMLDFAGLPAPKETQGASIRPLLEGRAIHSWRDAIYYHYYEESPQHNVAAHYGIRTERYKLIRFCSRIKAWEFYDLRTDPRELRNAYDDPAHAGTIAKLKRRLDRLRSEAGEAPEAEQAMPPAGAGSAK